MKIKKWVNYSDDLVEDVRVWSPECCDVILNYIIEHKYCFDGKYHQYGDFGVPIIEFDDGTVSPALYTQRAWGGLMAKAWNRIENTDKYDYIDFYYFGIPENLTENYPEG